MTKVWEALHSLISGTTFLFFGHWDSPLSVVCSMDSEFSVNSDSEVESLNRIKNNDGGRKTYLG